MAEKFQQDSRQDYLTMLRVLQFRDRDPLLFGRLYEKFAHQVIPRGGMFHTRNLSTGDTGFLKLERKNVKQLHTINDLTTVSEDEYGMAHDAFPGFDAMICNPPILFSVTTPKELQRQLSAATSTSLKASFNKLPETFEEPFQYHWVVPSNTFAQLENQSVIGTDSQEVDQYTMELSISEEPVYKHIVSSDNHPSAKRKQSEEQGESEEEVGTGDKVCKATLKSGTRKGKKCGRVNCRYHPTLRNSTKKRKRN